MMTLLTLHRTLCDVVRRHADVSTVLHGNTDENLLYTTIKYQFFMQSVSFLVLYQKFPYIGSSESRYDI